jgi:acetyl esterase
VPVDPLLAPLLVDYPQVPAAITNYDEFRTLSRAGADGMMTQLAEPGPIECDIRDVTIAVDNGEIALRTYTPRTTGPHPAHLYFHGGGWVVGSIHDLSADTVCRERCVRANYVVVSVNYRKAPEHKFPVPLDDCLAALRWVVASAEELGVRADCIVVGGYSAGGNLAAALALRARDEDGPAIALQLLEVPALDLHFATESCGLYGTGYALSSSDLEFSRAAYLASADLLSDPYVSPLLAPELSGLPPAYVMTAECDVLRDDGLAYVERLQAAGVDATLSLQPGHVHVSSFMTGFLPSARDWRDEVTRVLQQAAKV